MRDHEYQVRSVYPDGRVNEGDVTPDPREAGDAKRAIAAEVASVGGVVELRKRVVTRGPWQVVE